MYWKFVIGSSNPSNAQNSALKFWPTFTKAQLWQNKFYNIDPMIVLLLFAFRPSNVDAFVRLSENWALNISTNQSVINYSNQLIFESAPWFLGSWHPAIYVRNATANGRWKLVSAQLSNKCGYRPSCIVYIFAISLNNSLPLGKIQAYIAFY